MNYPNTRQIEGESYEYRNDLDVPTIDEDLAHESKHLLLEHECTLVRIDLTGDHGCIRNMIEDTRHIMILDVEQYDG